MRGPHNIWRLIRTGATLEVALPPAPLGQVWSRRIDTARPEAPFERLAFGPVRVAAHSVSALVLEDDG